MFVLKIFIQGMRRISIDVNFGKHIESDVILFGCKLLDLLVRARLLYIIIDPSEK